MPELARHCHHHADRRAIGVCVVTRRAVCAECSTQYRGVNYSKEGLAQYLASQGSATRRRGGGWGAALLIVLAPVALGGAYLGSVYVGEIVVDLIQAQQQDGAFG